MQSRRRSKRIAALTHTPSSRAFEGKLEEQHYSSKLIKSLGNQHRAQISPLHHHDHDDDHHHLNNKVNVQDPRQCRTRPARAQVLQSKKIVSFSPCSIVVDGEGLRTETPLAEPQGTDGSLVWLEAGSQNINLELGHGNGSARNQDVGPVNTVMLTGRHLPSMNKDKAGVVFDQRETLTAAEVTVIARTDRCVVDDDMFERETMIDTDDGVEQWDLYDNADYTIHEDYMSMKSWIALIFILFTISLLHFTIFFPHLFSVRIDQFEDDYTVYFKEKKGILLLGFIGCLLSAALVGSCCGCFAWMVTYFDSLEPGIVPPSPLSPRPIKSTSSHSYHFGYIMSVLNGFAMFLATVWWTSDKYLIV
ncbi:uncharacterized protein LOC135500895 [Lineus longissimus]|uniref:uncharacterized protein LOC135500895 n=1 Tax=Lineus longissimus TaxID=88925 RepID=UPI00315DAC46